MKRPEKVFKFGGASIKNAEAIKNVGKILADHKGERILVVVSALGKMTNALEKLVASHLSQDGNALALLEDIKSRHYHIIDGLFEPGHEIHAAVNDTFVEIDWALEEEPHPNYDFVYDQIVSVGELVSSKILTAYLIDRVLASQWLDARDVILTDDFFREGRVKWEQTIQRFHLVARPMLEKEGFVITQGFIGSTSENYTTTLGREGSDYSGAIFSFCMDAGSMTIWKDVPGVLTGDPTLFDNVVKIDRLSYKEAVEMTYYGAKVIHPKTIKPLQNKSIPLFVKSFIDPAAEGTFISDEVEDNYPPMVAIEKDQAIVHISTRDFSFVAEHHISFLFKLIAEIRMRVNMMQNTAISFSICVNDTDGKVDRFVNEIKKEFKVITDRGLELITVRHYRSDILDNLKRGKVVLLEERIRKTAQMVVKDVPLMRRKLKS